MDGIYFGVTARLGELDVKYRRGPLNSLQLQRPIKGRQDWKGLVLRL